MFGSLLLAKFLILKDDAGVPNLRIPMVSDNQGNIYSNLNQKTRRCPGSYGDAPPDPRCGPAAGAVSRVNTWADELTHPNFAHREESVCRISASSVFPFEHCYFMVAWCIVPVHFLRKKPCTSGQNCYGLHPFIPYCNTGFPGRTLRARHSI